MPPKRKQPGDAAPASATTTRATRASTKPTGSTAKSAANETASSSNISSRKTSARSGRAAAAVSVPSNEGENGADLDAMEVTPPPAKRARTSGPASTRKTAAKSAPQGLGAGQHIDDAPSNVSSTKEFSTPSSKPKSSFHIDHAPTSAAAPQPKTAKKTTKSEPYTPQRAMDLFSTYADSDDPTVIGPEGFEQLCADAGIPMDGSCPLILAWLMGAKEMAKISQQEWTGGTVALKVSSVAPLGVAVSELEDVLIKGQPPVKPTGKKDQEYDRAVYSSYVSNPKAAFQKLYQFSFALAKPEQSRNIDMETSIAFWTVLLVPKYPIMTDVLGFISEKGTYRATNKDLWSMMLEFCETVKPNLSDYEADGAWPTLLDDFVLWKKSQTSSGATDNMETDH